MEIANQIDHVTNGRLNVTSHHSTLVWQLPVIESRISKPEAHRNGNVEHRTSHKMMMMTTTTLPSS